MAIADRVQPYEHLVLDFLAYLEFERGLSRNTLEAYRSDLLQLGAHLEHHDLDALIVESTDSKTIIGLARLRERLRR